MNEHRDDLETELRERLALTESPFTWMPNRSDFEAVDPLYILMNNIPKDEDQKDNFTNYSKYMRRIFEKGNLEDTGFVVEDVEEWETFLSNKTTEDEFFKKNSLALKHVVYSSKAHLLLKMGEYEKVKSLIETIDEMECKDGHLRAAMFGLKAKFFDKYGSEGHRRALPNAREAMKLDPDEPEWIYLLANTMRNIRRGELYNMEGTEESRYEEMKLFKKLIALKEKGIYFIRLGNSYHDIANYLMYKNKKIKHTCNHWCRRCLKIWDYYEEGVRCFKKGIDIDPKKKNYLRVISGINGIAGYYRREFREIGKTWINAVLKECSTNPYLKERYDKEDDSAVYYAVGKYYQHVEKQSSEAVKYISIAADLGTLNAKKDLIRMRFDERSEIYNPFESPEEEILEVMKTYPDRPKKIECLCQLASYHLFIKNDLLKAKDYILQEKEDDPEFVSLYLRKHKSWFYEQYKHRDLLKEVFVRVSCRLEELSAESENEEAQALREFKNKASEALGEQFGSN